MLGQSSFRRILLLRILLLSIPILFLGTGVTFRKARSSLLTTAHANLEQSANQKARFIQDTVQSLETSLAIASETTVLQSGSTGTIQAFLNQLAPTLPAHVRCLQIKDRQDAVVLNTCGDQPIAKAASIKVWDTKENLSDAKRLKTYTVAIDPTQQPAQAETASQLCLVVSVPVYDAAGTLRYSLSAQTVLQQEEQDEPWLLQGYTIVLDQKGKILAHPLGDRVGQSIEQQPDSDLLQDVLETVKRGETGSRIFSGLTDNKTEWIGGFSPLRLSGTAAENSPFAVLAVTRMEHALQGLQEITQILLMLTAGLLAAHLIAMVYMARDIALPIEQLGKYALRIHKRNTLERAPKNFRIRELNHLAEVLDSMVGRLEERAKESESAWQEAENANQLKSEFLANTSHELRTPLNAIIGCIRLVKDGCCDSREEEVEFLEQADKAAIHLLKIINDLLDIQRIEEEKLPLSLELVDLQNILQEAIALETVPIQQKGLQLHTKGVTEPIMIRADSARLKQVLLNVIYNAIKFTDRGGITIDTRLEEHSINTDDYDPADPEAKSAIKIWVIVSVKDTGIGIDPEQQHKLFRPFVMVDGTTTRKFEGTGLGLAISRNLIELMGGWIQLESAGIDQGTTVEVALPVVELPRSTPAATNGSSPENPAKSAVEHSAIG